MRLIRGPALAAMLLFWLSAASATATVPSPSDNSLLRGASCAKPSSCWAVGSFQTTTGGELNQALRWRGKHWTQAKVPQPGGKLSTGASLNEALGWHGKKWVRDRTPQPGGSEFDDQNQLTGVSCTSQTNCWALGYFARGLSVANLSEALRFNGRKWRRVQTPQPGGRDTGNDTEPMGVYCASASSCRAVGMVSSGGSALLNLVLRWNGKKWATN